MNMACDESLPSRSRCRQAEFDTAPSIWFYVFMKTTIEMPDHLFRTAKSVAAIRWQTLKQLITTAIERELTGNQTIGSTELSTEDYLRGLDALAQDNATPWKTGKTPEESVVPSSTTLNRCRAVGTRTRSKRSVPETRYTMEARWGESLLCDPY